MIHVIIHVPITLSNIGFNNKYNNPLPFQIILRYKPCFECAQNTYLTRLTQNVEHCYIHTIFYTFFTTVNILVLFSSKSATEIIFLPPINNLPHLQISIFFVTNFLQGVPLVEKMRGNQWDQPSESRLITTHNTMVL